MEDGLHNYRMLIDRVEDRCQTILSTHGDQIRCQPGCASCCRLVSVFPVEAVHIRNWIGGLRESFPEISGESVTAGSGECPMLKNHICRIYPVRPLICRTHGYPMIIRESDEISVSCCPMNFSLVTRLPESALIDLDRLNQMLVVVNRLFLQSVAGALPWTSDRVSLSDILRVAAGSGYRS